ncbi:hypothetical protein [Neobacillus kokaensis]|uniref:Uncharacterized protein n=1 Tax=Neobacillus kokaensis TaxID=2759023 RepID=A0ABQ3N2P2_9BACI|nr:hypothetical protein [Neobacillus kokaensis]GHH99215.1 hypothetical protein AM1BK_27580 [Neobacillus kokaensis]
MNINGFARGLMARNCTEERFLIHVATCVEQQLQEWDAQFEVMVMKLKEYEIFVKYGDDDYHLRISEEDVSTLQKTGPYHLDQKIWRELENQGLKILEGFGNYLDTVLN